MGNCTRCGTTIDGEGLCSSCEAASRVSTDVPCQRCGMYLPPYELKMWNSRLYCSYCIMDLQDEERRHSGENRRREEKDRQSQWIGKTGGVCERCGRDTDRFYTVFGRNLCANCYFEGSHEPESAKPPLFGQVIKQVRKILGFPEKMKIIAKETPPQVFDLQKRKMVDAKEGKAVPKKEEATDTKENPFNAEKQEPVLNDGEQRPAVFDLQKREMVGEKPAILSSQPLKEEKQAEKKPSAKSKKAFYSLHKSVPKKIKKD